MVTLDFERTRTSIIYSMTTLLTIQQAAAATGLSVHTLRYYERIGLIDPVPRQTNSHRFYRPEDMRWIMFLIKLRSTGMPIQQMLHYAALRRRGDDPESVAERKYMLEQHAFAVAAELTALQDTLAVLHAKVGLYSAMEETLKAAADNRREENIDHGKHNLRTRREPPEGSR